jgi:methyltransferase (TIGR00027 family)
VRGVAATALWTAACRADETLRPDPLVVDPLAAFLCGEAGMALGHVLEREGHAHDAIVVRTRLVDERILAAAAQGFRTVLTLGAGLDARPYRLDLGAGARWIEADLPEVIAWKERRLQNARATGVAVERHALDLRDGDALQALLSSLLEARLLVVLEGVLAYLEPPNVRALLERLARRPFTRVVCDVGGGMWARFLARRPAEIASKAGAPYRFQVRNAARLFESLGFRVGSDTSLVDWDESSARPRFAHGRKLPWILRLVPGLRDLTRVVVADSPPIAREASRSP